MTILIVLITFKMFSAVEFTTIISTVIIYIILLTKCKVQIVTLLYNTTLILLTNFKLQMNFSYFQKKKSRLLNIKKYNVVAIVFILCIIHTLI